MLSTLLLTFLTLAGGAATGGGAASVPTARNLVPGTPSDTVPPAHSGAPASGGRAARTATPQTHDAALHTTADGGHDRAIGAEADAARATHVKHDHPEAAADPARAPRAGTGRAHLLINAPPPPHDALPLCPPVPAEPRRGVLRIVANSLDAPSGRRGELPGVRGPPGRTVGHTTVYQSCSADPAPRPH